MSNGDNNGNALDFTLDLGPFGAPGYNLRDRIDFSGHLGGGTDPHLNSDLERDGSKIRLGGDLASIQLHGFNGMQK